MPFPPELFFQGKGFQQLQHNFADDSEFLRGKQLQRGSQLGQLVLFTLSKKNLVAGNRQHQTYFFRVVREMPTVPRSRADTLLGPSPISSEKRSWVRPAFSRASLILCPISTLISFLSCNITPPFAISLSNVDAIWNALSVVK